METYFLRQEQREKAGEKLEKSWGIHSLGAQCLDRCLNTRDVLSILLGAHDTQGLQDGQVRGKGHSRQRPCKGTGVGGEDGEAGDQGEGAGTHGRCAGSECGSARLPQASET